MNTHVISSNLQICLMARKPVFRALDKDTLLPAFLATEASKSLEIWGELERVCIILTADNKGANQITDG